MSSSSTNSKPSDPQKPLGINNHASSPLSPPPMGVTMTYAGFYVLSGCSQPLIMTLFKEAGMADPTCQLYMLFYYLGPASVIFSLLMDPNPNWPSRQTILKGCGIALFGTYVAIVCGYLFISQTNERQAIFYSRSSSSCYYLIPFVSTFFAAIYNS